MNIGMRMAGTPRTIKAASLGLVTNSSTSAPTIIRPFLINIEKPKPITTCSCVVSLRMRETISPVRAESKKPGESSSTWSNTARRMSVTTRSPVDIIR